MSVFTKTAYSEIWGKRATKGPGWNQTRDVAVLRQTPQAMGHQERLDGRVLDENERVSIKVLLSGVWAHKCKICVFIYKHTHLLITNIEYYKRLF